MPVIEARELAKRYGRTVAVDGLSFQVRPGHVTGFLGPNGAGKSTTMRMMLDLDRPSEGQVLIDGRHYRRLPEPLRRVGALLEAKAVHGGRSAYNHLLWLAQSNRIPKARVREVLELVGLEGVARNRANVIGRGRLLADTTVRALVEASSGSYVRVRTPEPERMRDALAMAGIRVTPRADGALEAYEADAAKIGELAAAHGLTVHEVSVQPASLEEAVIRLTGAGVEHRARGRQR